MMFIEHRANDHRRVANSDFAEIDVWVGDDCRLVLKHDVKGDVDSAPPILLSEYLKYSTYKRYFVNIKQSLDDEDVRHIVKTIGRGRLIGLFDIPWPMFHRLANSYLLSGVDLYARFSEHERNRGSSKINHLWLDPLDKWNALHYLEQFIETAEDDKVILASPELHGASFEEAYKVWEIFGIYNYPQVIGLVTKHPVEARKAFYKYA